MVLTIANVTFVGAGALFYLFVRCRILRRPSDPARRVELLASLTVGLLVVAGFGLAHMGMNEEWTGRLAVSDLSWLAYGVVVAGALLEAHILLRIQRSRADELVLPVAAFLVSLGLVNVYVWETRDANAYVTTVALPALRDYQTSLAEDRSLRPTRRVEIQFALGTVPNELSFETKTRSATVLDGDWLRTYNGAVRRFERARALDPRPRADLPVREVRLDGRLKTQLVAAVIGLLAVPLVLFFLSRLRPRRAVRPALPLIGATAVVVGLVVAALSTSRSREVPALVAVGAHSVTVVELLKLGLVVLLALALSRAPRARSVQVALAAAGFAVMMMIWRDLGAGIALLAVAAMMLSFVVGRAWRRRLVLAAVASVCLVPILAPVLDSHLPQTARTRIAMWSDPLGAFERAELGNDVMGSLHRIAQYRRTTETEHAVGAAPPPGLDTTAGEDVKRLEGELRWRLQSTRSREGAAEPLVPGADPVETLLLRDAESLWTDLGGYREASVSPIGRSALQARVDDAIERLKVGAEEVEGGRTPRRAVAPDNFQLQRSLYALRAGGALGVGLGRGRPEMVPGLTEDVALASLGEALGVGGLVLVSLLVLLLAGRGVELARRQRSLTLALLASGLSVLLALQALISLGGLTGLLPFTGLTFPFISRSGTAVVAGFLALAVLMAVGTAPKQLTEPAFRGRRPTRLLNGAGFPAAFALALAGLVLVQLTGRTITSGPFLSALPGPAASFLHASDQWAVPDYRKAPGPILDRHGRVLAKSDGLGRARVYPDPEVATGLGHTLLQLGIGFREELLRSEPSRRVGPALVTTIDAGVQRALGDALDHGAVAAGLPEAEKLRGAAVLVDVKNGGIVALESRPTFSLAELADPVAWAQAETKERRAGFPYRYLNRVVHGFYPPGSIFKTVTAAAALERGFHTLYSRDFDYRHGDTGRRLPDGIHHTDAWHELPLRDGPPITDGNHPHLDSWRLNLAEAYAWSCNVAFAELGAKLGAADLVGFARRFGFERPLVVPGLGATRSTLDNDWTLPANSRFLAQSESALARTAFGQGQARVTPLQMALVPAAIANGGKVMQPHVVAGWRPHPGARLRRYQPQVFADTGLSATTIAEMRAMMRASVTYGWASTARVNPNNAKPGVAGKTGSAEWSDTLDASHAWFIGYFPTERPRLALAVIVERGGAGPTVAARIARRIFAAGAVQDYVREEDLR